MEVEKYLKLDGLKLLAPVALFASQARGDQAVAGDGRLNRKVDAVKNHVDELAGAAHLGFQVSSRTRGNVAFRTFHTRVCRV